jgi:hypothetical protein
MNRSASHPAMPPIMMAAIHPTVASFPSADSFLLLGDDHPSRKSCPKGSMLL